MTNLRFKKKTGDLTWGKLNYSVTRSQKAALDGLMFLLYGHSPERVSLGFPSHTQFFCSQSVLNGSVVLGIHGRSVTVDRHGRMRGNL